MIDKREITHCGHVAYFNPDAAVLGDQEFDEMFAAGLDLLLNDIDRAGTLRCGSFEEERAERSRNAFENPRGGRLPIVSVGPSGIGGPFQQEF